MKKIIKHMYFYFVPFQLTIVLFSSFIITAVAEGIEGGAQMEKSQKGKDVEKSKMLKKDPGTGGPWEIIIPAEKQKPAEIEELKKDERPGGPWERKPKKIVP